MTSVKRFCTGLLLRTTASNPAKPAAATVAMAYSAVAAPRSEIFVWSGVNVVFMHSGCRHPEIPDNQFVNLLTGGGQEPLWVIILSRLRGVRLNLKLSSVGVTQVSPS